MSGVPHSRYSLMALVPTALTIILAGCAVGPDFVRPAPPEVTDYTAEPLPDTTATAEIPGGDAQRFLHGADIPGRWWTLFGPAELGEIVDQALLANPDLEAAQSALRQVQELNLAARGSLFPAVTAGGGAQRQQFTNQGGQFSPGGGATTLTLYNASVGVSYLLDVFGATRRALEASGSEVEFQRFQLEATYLTLISNVLTAAIQDASLRAQIEAFEEIIAAQSQALDLTTQQFELGAVARGDVLAQQTQLTQTQASLPELQKQLAQVRTQLAVLLGRYPAEGMIPSFALTNLVLPQELPLSVPSQLVDQRPDVRAAEALLHQASAQIGVATANMLPQFSLTGNYSTSSDSLPSSAGLLSADSLAWNLGAGLTAPIFRGRELSRRRQAALYAFDGAEAQYRSTVLAAFANVANVLDALRYDAETLRAQQVAEETAAQSLEITTERFRAGAIAYLPLLDAQRVYQQVRISLVQAQAGRFADTVALYQALGGGWWNREDVVASTRSNPIPLP